MMKTYYMNTETGSVDTKENWMAQGIALAELTHVEPSEYRGYGITNGEIDTSEEEYLDWLNEIHDNVFICGMTYSAGEVLRAVDPIAFRCGKSDFESQEQSDFESALDAEAYDDITWVEFSA
jgi:hypothetical protein